MLNACLLQRLGGIEAERAGLGPEIVEIRWIAIHDAVDERSEHARIAEGDFLEIKPGARREAEARDFE
jgi:hypothetical protein